MRLTPQTAALALGAVALAALAAGGGYWASTALTDATDGIGQGDYALMGTDGAAFTEDTLKGAPSAVFFGFTHCPDVCPTTLGDIGHWQDELVPEGETLRSYFVTVDPERDTLEALEGYVSWVPGAVGVTGPREEIDAAIEAFRIYAAKVPLEEGDYTMDHSALVLLFDERGRFFEPVRYGEDPAMVEERLGRLFSG